MKGFILPGMIPNINAEQFEALVRQFYKEKAESNAYLQKRKRMTQYERARGAVEKMSKDIMLWNAQGGVAKRWDECHKEAETIAEKAERK
jgi:hypothetical protein